MELCQEAFAVCVFHTSKRTQDQFRVCASRGLILSGHRVDEFPQSSPEVVSLLVRRSDQMLLILKNRLEERRDRSAAILLGFVHVGELGSDVQGRGTGSERLLA